jgi:hypothetical protein
MYDVELIQYTEKRTFYFRFRIDNVNFYWNKNFSSIIKSGGNYIPHNIIKIID